LGNDTLDGSIGAPWATLQRAAEVVNPGDTVIVRAGTYAGFDLDRDGTAAARITFSAEPGALIDARNARTPDGINLEGADYIVIEGFEVRGVTRAGIRSVTNHHVTIRNNLADSNGRWGIFTGFSDDLLIENNTTSRSVAEHGIYVSNSGDRPVIRGNISFLNRAAGIHMNGDLSQGGDGLITGALVERNTIYENGVGGGSGLNADGVQNSRFQNNLIYDNHASGISLYQIDGAAGSSGNVVVNNTIIQAADARWALNIQDGSTGNTVLNNILYNNHSFRGSIDISSDSLPGLVSDYNVVMSRFVIGDSNVQSLAQWRTTTGQDQHSIVATPAQLFVSASGDDYHLSPTSPALNAGTAMQAPPIDLEGRARPQGSGFDIGALERAVATSSSVVGRHVFYNNSVFDGENAAAGAADDSAIATDKQALLPGQTATFANYTSYNRGINGVMVDITGLAGTPTAGDFSFRVGNNDNPSGWTPVTVNPTVTVRPGAGLGGASRVTLIWPDGAIIRQWLQVTVRATAATGLAAPDVFYFGSAPGESGDSADSAAVSIVDELLARNNPHGASDPVGVTYRFDYNRDGRVSVIDQLLARNNFTTQDTVLQLIRVPASLTASSLRAGQPKAGEIEPAVQPGKRLLMRWLGRFR
jgi:parallel beta-helix repeat protein